MADSPQQAYESAYQNEINKGTAPAAAGILARQAKNAAIYLEGKKAREERRRKSGH